LSIVHVKEGEFEQEVLKAALPVCIDFWADWCEPCRMLSPTIDELSTAYCGKMKFVKINIDEAPKIALEHKILSIPTVSIFVGGKEVKRLIGLRDKAELKQEFDSILLK
jgi:thioredoxin 1